MRLIVVAVTCMWGCGSNRDSNEPNGGSDEPNGSFAACKIAGQAEITVQAARDLGFSVDHELALLGRTHQGSFHRGDFTCTGGAVPSVDGQIFIDATLQRMELRTNAPTSVAIDPASCPNFLVYRVSVALRTDEGSVSGQFDAEGVSYVDGMFLSALPEPNEFAGTLGIRVDSTRSHRAVVAIHVVLRDRSPNGELFTQVSYTDGGSPPSEDGDGLFWPADDVDTHFLPHCGWLRGGGGVQSRMSSLDEYNRP